MKYLNSHTYKLIIQILKQKRCKTIFNEEKPILKVYKAFKCYLKVYQAVRAVSRSGSSKKLSKL
jgi:hypothetical protein